MKFPSLHFIEATSLLMKGNDLAETIQVFIFISKQWPKHFSSVYKAKGQLLVLVLDALLRALTF